MVTVISTLAAAIDEVSIATDTDELAAALVLLDRLTAAVTDAAHRVNTAGLWELDGATSMVAWLKTRCSMSAGAAVRMVAAGHKLAQLPVTNELAAAGALSHSQVEVITSNLNPKLIGLFAAHEAGLAPTMVGLTVADTVAVMGEWRQRAEETLAPDPADDQPPVDDEPVNSLHHSQTFRGTWATDAAFTVLDGEIVATALRVAMTPDVGGEPRRPVAQKRGDALADICRYFLDHHDHPPASAGRHRPHVNVVVKARDDGRLDGELVNQTRLVGSHVLELLCDCFVYRMVVQGSSTIMDYGTATRTVSDPMFNALLARDRHCRFPGCDRAPVWCQGHHGHHVSDNGPTRIGNLALFCARHHHLIHKPGWKCKIEEDGTVHITFPDKTVSTTKPPGRLL